MPLAADGYEITGVDLAAREQGPKRGVDGFLLADDALFDLGVDRLDPPW